MARYSPTRGEHYALNPFDRFQATSVTTGTGIYLPNFGSFRYRKSNECDLDGNRHQPFMSEWEHPLPDGDFGGDMFATDNCIRCARHIVNRYINSKRGWSGWVDYDTQKPTWIIQEDPL